MFPALTTLAVSAALLASTALRADEQPPDRAPVTCINSGRIVSTHSIDDQTVLFFMRGGKQAYQNHLPRKCPNLQYGDGFSYQATSRGLCSTDGITTIPRTGLAVRCGLGKFEPITADQAEALRAAHQARGTEAKPAEPPKESATAPAHE